MKHTKIIAFAAACGILGMVACQSPNDKIVKKWQVTAFENPTTDSILKEREKSIDTITMVDSNMVMFFQTDNLDSIKALMRDELNQFKVQQGEAAKQSYMDFRSSGTVIMAGGLNVDSATWAIVNKDKLIFSNFPKEGVPATHDTFEILKISDKELSIKYSTDLTSSTINLRPYTKEDSVTASGLIEEQRKQMEEQQKQMEELQRMMQEQNQNQASN